MVSANHASSNSALAAVSPRAKELLLPSVLSERLMCPWRSGRGSFEISEASRLERKSF